MDVERERVLARMDDLARALVARVAPIRFGLATTPAEKEATYRLRAQAVLAHGWAGPDDLCSGIERDRYDDRAVHIAGWDGDRMAATARIVFPVSGDTMPVQEHFQVNIPPTTACANLDRMVVAAGYADPGHRLFCALAFKGWIELRRHGYQAFIGVITPGILRLYRQLGFHVSPIGEPRVHWGEERLPCLFDPVEGFTQPGTTTLIPVDSWADRARDHR